MQGLAQGGASVRQWPEAMARRGKRGRICFLLAVVKPKGASWRGTP
jgi:hypothetical protein